MCKINETGKYLNCLSKQAEEFLIFTWLELSEFMIIVSLMNEWMVDIYVNENK